MGKYVVDASVGFKWFFPEEYDEQAEVLLTGSHTLLVPDLFYVEFANILWKHTQKKDIDEKVAKNILLSLASFTLQVTSDASLYRSAFEIASLSGCSAYDGLYLALAVREEAVFITADKRLVNQLSQGPLAKYICAVETFSHP